MGQETSYLPQPQNMSTWEGSIGQTSMQSNWNTGMNNIAQFIPTSGQNYISPVQLEYLQLGKDNLDFQKQIYNNQQNSFANQYLKPFSMGAQAINGLSNIYLGFQNLKLQKQQLGLAREQWAATKAEMDRIANVRQKLTAQYG